MSRKLIVLAILLAMTWSGVHAVTSAQDAAVTLRYPIFTDPETLNPFTAESIAASTVLTDIYEGMVGYDAAANAPKPLLAESWDITQDDAGHDVYTFHLRQGVLFHNMAGVTLGDDQREVTADVILWNYQIALNGDEEISANAPVFDVILGAKEFTEGAADTIAGIQVIDRYTIQFTLQQPDRLFLINGASLAIESPAAYEQLGEAVNSTPVGTGPFQFVEWLPQQHITLAANPDYWNAEQPQVDGIDFIFYADAETALADYRADKLDFMFSIAGSQREAVMSEFGDQFHEQPSLHVRYFGFNMETGFLAEQPLVRQAMNYALDREQAWNVLDAGARFPADKGMLPPSMPASTPATIYSFDLEKAAALLEQAGFPNGEGIPVITVNVLQGIDQEAQLNLWKEDLAKIGIQIEFKVESNETYFDTIMADDTLVFQNGWAAGLNDPSDVFDYLILDGTSAMKYNNPAVNDLLRAARSETDETARNGMYQQVHDMVMADSAVVASAYGKITWLQKPWIAGFQPSGGGAHTARLEEVSLSSARP